MVGIITWKLLLRGPNCQTPEVFRRHNIHQPHQRQRWVCIQAGSLVQSQQLRSQHSKDCGDDSGLQVEPPTTEHHLHDGQFCVCGGNLQVPGNHHLPGPEVDCQHRHHQEKGPAEAQFCFEHVVFTFCNNCCWQLQSWYCSYLSGCCSGLCKYKWVMDLSWLTDGSSVGTDSTSCNIHVWEMVKIVPQ